MGTRTYSLVATANITLTTTSETELVQVDSVDVPNPGGQVRLRGWCQLTTGTGTTTVTLRIRRGTDTSGTLVDEANAVTIGAAAGSTEQFDIMVDEAPGELAGASYVLTAQQAAATGNGSAVQASLAAEVEW